MNETIKLKLGTAIIVRFLSDKNHPIITKTISAMIIAGHTPYNKMSNIETKYWT
jgi:hypothetical protein